MLKCEYCHKDYEGNLARHQLSCKMKEKYDNAKKQRDAIVQSNEQKLICKYCGKLCSGLKIHQNACIAKKTHDFKKAYADGYAAGKAAALLDAERRIAEAKRAVDQAEESKADTLLDAKRAVDQAEQRKAEAQQRIETIRSKTQRQVEKVEKMVRSEYERRIYNAEKRGEVSCAKLQRMVDQLKQREAELIQFIITHQNVNSMSPIDLQ